MTALYSLAVELLIRLLEPFIADVLRWTFGGEPDGVAH